MDGAVRYACPVNGSVVLITDPAALSSLTPPLARMLCRLRRITSAFELGDRAAGAANR